MIALVSRATSRRFLEGLDRASRARRRRGPGRAPAGRSAAPRAGRARARSAPPTRPRRSPPRCGRRRRRAWARSASARPPSRRRSPSPRGRSGRPASIESSASSYSSAAELGPGEVGERQAAREDVAEPLGQLAVAPGQRQRPLDVAAHRQQAGLVAADPAGGLGIVRLRRRSPAPARSSPSASSRSAALAQRPCPCPSRPGERAAEHDPGADREVAVGQLERSRRARARSRRSRRRIR